VSIRDRIPRELLAELSRYVGGERIYVPRYPERSRRRLSIAERELRDKEIVKRFARGQTRSRIAGEMGISPRHVGRIVDAAGSEIKSEHRASRAMIARIRELRRRGKSWRQISEILGISHEKARSLINRSKVRNLS
jgi:DNA-binding CsgD family transcriptional regulator